MTSAESAVAAPAAPVRVGENGALWYLLLTNFLGGSSYLALAYALNGFSPQAIIFWRTLIGGAFFVPALFIRRSNLRIAPADRLRILLIATFGYAVPLYLGAVGQKHSSVTNAALLIGVEPIAIVLLSALFLGETLTALRVAAIASGCIGAAFITAQGVPLWAAAGKTARGDMLLIAQGVCWSLYTVLGKPTLKRVDPFTFTGLTVLISLAPLTAIAWPIAWPAGAAPSASMGLLFLGFFVTFVATWAWNKGLEKAAPSQVASFVFLQPLVGVLGGVLLQGDPFTAWTALGGALILLGAYHAH